MPTADQVAKIIVVACRTCHVDPLDIDKRPIGSDQSWKAIKLRLARAYAALAMREIFKGCIGFSISRMVGAPEPAAYLGRILTMRAKGDLMRMGYDEEVFQQILRDISLEPVEVKQKVIDEDPPSPSEAATEAQERSDAPPVPVQRASSANAPAPYIPGKAGRDKAGSRRRLEEELRQAILNTGGKLVDRA